MGSKPQSSRLEPVVFEAEAKATIFVLKVKDMPVYKLAVHH